jgi:multicomponent Na+:H+ antiporter subunit B
MNSIVLQTTARTLIALLMVLSLILLIRGHNEPGGGFIGGLVGATAVTVALMAFGARSVRNAIPLHPRHLLGIGLAAAVASGLFAAVAGGPFMAAQWVELVVPYAGVPLKIGTPLLFDIGVYLVVIGFTLTIIRTLEEVN